MRKCFIQFYTWAGVCIPYVYQKMDGAQLSRLPHHSSHISKESLWQPAICNVRLNDVFSTMKMGGIGAMLLTGSFSFVLLLASIGSCALQIHQKRLLKVAWWTV